MIPSSHILTIGPEYNPPKGGVAQCIATYGKTVFSDFQVLSNSCEGSQIKKLWKAISSLILLFFILLFKRHISIVHIHTASYNSFKRSSFFVRLSKAMGRKVVIHIHGGGFKEYYVKEKNYIDSILAKCDAIITLSTTWKTFFEETVGHKNVHIVPNIITRPIPIAIEKDEMFHLLFMGHICKAKGIFDLVEVIQEYQDEYHGKLILDIGGGLYEVDTLKQIIKDYQLEDIIHFHGWVSGNKKIELLNLADAFILPSYTEGVPISILEAESYGLPILSTYIGGIPEIVIDGENGFLFNPGDKPAMKKAIDTLLTDKKLVAYMSASSLKRSELNMPQQVELALNSTYNNI